jgi:Domain of unknown function (DUF4192)
VDDGGFVHKRPEALVPAFLRRQRVRMDPSLPGIPPFPSDPSAGSGSADGPRVPPGTRARERTFIRVTGPADLVAAVPYLVGFQPVRSVVVVSLRGARLRCGLVARVDVPPPGQLRPWADELASFVLRDEPREVVVLVYHDRPWRAARRPLGPAVQALERRFADDGVGLKDALYVTQERFWSYLCTEPRCCPPEGRPVEAGRSSAVAASYVAEGKAPLTDRGAVVAQLHPGPPDVLAATRKAAVRATQLALTCDEPHHEAHWLMWQTGTAELFSRLVRRRLDGDTRAPSTAEVGRVVAGLRDRTTRDLVGVRSTGWLRALPGMGDWLRRHPTSLADSGRPLDGLPHEGLPHDGVPHDGVPNDGVPHDGLSDDGLPDDGGTDLGQLRRLLLGCARPEDPRVNSPQGQQEVAAVLADLCRRSDGDLAVAPLVLAGMQAWANGDGVLAWAAVDRALALDPGCTMAGLLEQLLQYGIAPAWVDQDRAEDEAVPPREPG